MLQLEIYSDVICPWCFVGKRRLERALDGLGMREAVTVRWLPFELNPDMPTDGMARADYRARKFGPDRAALLDREMTARGREEGIGFRFDRIDRTPSTRKAHRLLAFAQRDGGSADALKEALLRAYFEEALDIGRTDTLLAIAERCGVGAAEAEAAVADPEIDREVSALEARAHELGVSGVPFFIGDGRWAVSGAQPAEAWAGILREQATGAAA